MIRTAAQQIFSKNITRFDPCGDVQPLPPNPGTPCQLYVHVPFCEELCPYCSFHRVRFSRDIAQRYFDALHKELRHYAERGFSFSDVYVGGGTPTIAPDLLKSTISLIRSLFSVREISVETNPNGLNDEVIGTLKDLKIDRLSVGVQSFDDELLRKMGRYEKYGSGADIRLKLAGVQGIFPTLNVDMIFNLPGQTFDSLDKDLAVITELGVDQVSFYPLMTAPSVKTKVADTMGAASAANLHPFYKRILAALKTSYHASSAWCFSRNNGMIDEYIVRHEQYVGAGSGAFGYVGGVMYATAFSIDQYIERAGRGLTGITHRKALTARQRIRYEFLVKLFGTRIDRDDVRRAYGGAWLFKMPELIVLRLLGGLYNDGRWIRLTERGMYIWIVLMAEFFNAVNAVREQMRRESGIV